ncbi:hypothetical protein BOTBODRAFT_31466 [Botryobasidium botryosum FD-172 SS1]|uniref:Mitochondrial inner membrane protease ATP23 n=1 Tax=Botryobasidium botryosum (strain FD-172 SS1) TaxID=930990 RepID=A0A067MUL6_BOTB1|nr:hypothetical protein BOTBODRAFT_31466 [Botryobasidium botryosum FD-172 SS1]
MTSTPSPEPSPSSFTSLGEEKAFDRWRRSAAWITGVGLSPEDQTARGREKALAAEESQWRRCEKWKADLLRNSPAVTFMLQHLRYSGCAVTPAHIQCHPCGIRDSSTTKLSPVAGGFSPDHGIMMCQDGFVNKKHMEHTMVHELVHMYDHAKFNVDWSDIRHHACSEIRAANLSGDCTWWREVQRGFFTFSKQHQACVRRRAVLSVRNNPACPDAAAAERAVNEVWESCFKDTRPFDEIY